MSETDWLGVLQRALAAETDLKKCRAIKRSLFAMVYGRPVQVIDGTVSPIPKEIEA